MYTADYEGRKIAVLHTGGTRPKGRAEPRGDREGDPPRVVGNRRNCRGHAAHPPRRSGTVAKGSPAAWSPVVSLANCFEADSGKAASQVSNAGGGVALFVVVGVRARPDFNATNKAMERATWRAAVDRKISGGNRGGPGVEEARFAGAVLQRAGPRPADGDQGDLRPVTARGAPVTHW